MAICEQIEEIIGGHVLTLAVHRSSDVSVVQGTGRVVRGKEVDRLIGVVTTLATRLVIIDLAGVTAIDAAGLGALAELARSAAHQRRSIQLVNPSKRVRDLLERTKLTAVLPIVSAAVLEQFCVTAA